MHMPGLIHTNAEHDKGGRKIKRLTSDTSSVMHGENLITYPVHPLCATPALVNDRVLLLLLRQLAVKRVDAKLNTQDIIGTQVGVVPHVTMCQKHHLTSVHSRRLKKACGTKHDHVRKRMRALKPCVLNEQNEEQSRTEGSRKLTDVVIFVIAAAFPLSPPEEST